MVNYGKIYLHFWTEKSLQVLMNCYLIIVVIIIILPVLASGLHRINQNPQ